MRGKKFLIAAGCFLTVIGLFPAFLSGAPPASKEKVIYAFKGGSDGLQPQSELVFDATGSLYGTTTFGGIVSQYCQYGCGTVFKLTPTKEGWKHQVLYSFAGLPVDGERPMSGLIFDRSGNLYGTTFAGGSHEWGTVFQLSPSANGKWVEKVLYSFNASDGADLTANLTLDNKGNLYGTASGGGYFDELCEDGCGTAFELSPQANGSWVETTLHVFQDAPDGAKPSSGLVMDSDGNLYGATSYGGNGRCDRYSFNGPPGCGSLYKLNFSKQWTESVAYNFARGGGFGVYPSGGLIVGPVGRLYGSSQAGGDGYGAVFELHDSEKKGWQQESLHSFSGRPDGRTTIGRLARDANGNLFGVASARGKDVTAIVFELHRSKNQWKEKVLYRFPTHGEYGFFISAGLVVDSSGHIYGTTGAGGNMDSGCTEPGGCGTVYEVTP